MKLSKPEIPTLKMPKLKILAIFIGGFFVILSIFGFILIKLTTQPLKVERPKIATISAVPNSPVQKYNISFNGDSFVPDIQTVKVRDEVTVKNDSKINLLLALGEHESHVPLKGFEERLTKPGESYAFTPQEKGNFDLHNHLRVKKYGRLIIN